MSKKKNNNNDTFVNITNKDIYESILDIKQQLNEFIINNQREHDNILRKQEYTNGKVRLNRWIATTALTTALLVIGWFISIKG